MDESAFDVVILGTGLTESITAAALAKAGFKVAHIDENPYYGGQEASLSLDEFIQWADTQASLNNPRYTSITHSDGTLPQSRQYSICLRPSIIPSMGPIISSLVSSGVSKYGGFRLLERVGAYDSSGGIKNVPGNKEDVFKNKNISLIDKRRLMRFLMFAAGQFEEKKELEGNHDLPFYDFLEKTFSLNKEMASAVLFSLAYCFSLSDPTLPSLQRIRRYLLSAGRYGPSPFLIGHYGGTGEIAQGFCRAAAVSGGVYILGRRLTSVNHTSSSPSAPDVLNDSPQSSESPHYSIKLEDVPDTLTCDVLISDASHVPPHLMRHSRQLSSSSNDDAYQYSSVARCIAIVDHPIVFPSSPSLSETSNDDAESEQEEQDTSSVPHVDTGMIVFPPFTIPGGSTTTAATVLVTGEGTMSTPKGKWILYIALPLLPTSNTALPQDLLRPYLDATLALSVLPSTPGALPQNPPQLTPLFTAFYMQHSPLHTPIHPITLEQDADSSLTISPQTYLVPAPLLPALPLPEAPDAAATHAEAVFWETVKILQSSAHVRQRASSNASEEPAVENFWPPPDTETDEQAEEDW